MKSTSKFKNAFLAASFFLLSGISFGQLQTNIYGTIDVFNSSGDNPHDFVFSYDIINGSHTCINNFEVRSNLSVATSFSFNIFINDVFAYTGQVNVAAFGSVFFNDAFINCNSVSSRIAIVVI